jgi:hypothetical protein
MLENINWVDLERMALDWYDQLQDGYINDHDLVKH